jgi:prefoldin subunit 5
MKALEAEIERLNKECISLFLHETRVRKLEAEVARLTDLAAITGEETYRARAKRWQIEVEELRAEVERLKTQLESMQEAKDMMVDRINELADVMIVPKFQDALTKERAINSVLVSALETVMYDNRGVNFDKAREALAKAESLK